MEELLALLGLVPEDKKADAEKYAETVKSKFKALGDEVTEKSKQVVEAQNKLSETVGSRDKLKTKILSLAGNLAIDTASKTLEEVVQQIIDKKGKTEETDALIAKNKEIEQLESKITELNTTLATTQEESQKQVTEVILERDLAMVLPKYNAVEQATPYLIKDILSMPKKFEDGKVVFLDDAGVPLRTKGGDEVATIETIVKERKEAEIESGKSFFFDNEVQNSGAGGGGKKAGQINTTPKF